jgi:DNA-binding MarR family transcriptional regulator
LTDLRGPLASTGYWLKLGALAWQRELDQALRPLTLTTTQFSVLAGAAWLSRDGSTPTQQQIADFAGADRMMTSKVLRTLEARQLIRRVSNPSDARVRRVELTEAGRVMITESTARAREVDQRLFGTDVTLRDLLVEQFGHLGGPVRSAPTNTTALGRVR